MPDDERRRIGRRRRPVRGPRQVLRPDPGRRLAGRHDRRHAGPAGDRPADAEDYTSARSGCRAGSRVGPSRRRRRRTSTTAHDGPDRRARKTCTRPIRTRPRHRVGRMTRRPSRGHRVGEGGGRLPVRRGRRCSTGGRRDHRGGIRADPDRVRRPAAGRRPGRRPRPPSCSRVTAGRTSRRPISTRARKRRPITSRNRSARAGPGAPPGPTTWSHRAVRGGRRSGAPRGRGVEDAGRGRALADGQVGAEGLGGPSWQEPTAVEVGADPERRPVPERDVPAAFLTGLVAGRLAAWARSLIGDAVRSPCSRPPSCCSRRASSTACSRRHHQPATARGPGDAVRLVLAARVLPRRGRHDRDGRPRAFATFLWYLTVPAAAPQATWSRTSA